MKVDESTFLRMFLPTCHAALAIHAMYYGEGEWSNRKQSIKQIATQMQCSEGDVRSLLDLADKMLADASVMQPGAGSGNYV